MIKNWIQAARPKTLPAAIVPVAVGAAESHRMGVFDWWPVVVCVVFSLLVQVATNMANDYFDHVKGADNDDRVGPERLVAAGKIAPRAMFRASLIVFGVAFLVGLNLVAYRGWELLIVGVLSIVFGYGYTGGPFPLAYRGLGDVFVILFFGLVATVGTVYVISNQITLESALLGLALGLLANNILVVNNYRDVETDTRAGKMTLVARFGRPFGRGQYWLQLLAAFSLLAAYGFWTRNPWMLLVGPVLFLAVSAAKDLAALSGTALNGLLARSALVVLAAGALSTLGIVLG